MSLLFTDAEIEAMVSSAFRVSRRPTITLPPGLAATVRRKRADRELRVEQLVIDHLEAMRAGIPAWHVELRERVHRDRLARARARRAWHRVHGGEAP